MSVDDLRGLLKPSHVNIKERPMGVCVKVFRLSCGFKERLMICSESHINDHFLRTVKNFTLKQI